MTDKQPIANALLCVARALDRLGNADAMTPMGGLEAHGKAILDAAEKIGSSFDMQGVEYALKDIATSIECHANAIDRLARVLEQR